MVMFHQAGRSANAGNMRPACYNASQNGTAGGPGAYAACRLQTYLALQQLVKSGTVRAIGVSNWQIRDFEQIFAATGTYPSALEVEVHPWWHEDDLISYCQSKGIAVVSYAPVALGAPERLNTPEVLDIATAHAITPAQVLLLWGAQKTGGVLIPRSANASHMVENMQIWELAPLTAAEFDSLSHFPQKKLFNVYCQDFC
jgi:diketogulonate reductase-like aldo/keto reductase